MLAYVTGGKPLKAKIGGKAVDVPITRKFFPDAGEFALSMPNP